MWAEERFQFSRGIRSIAGIDEAGRGPLAGPVVAACVQLPFEIDLIGVNDSKKLKPEQRDSAFEIVKDAAISIGVGICEPERIDKLNILRATHQAMREAYASLDFPVDLALIDGLPVHPFPILQKAIVKGDSKSMSIAAASIIAKVTRDRLMDKYHEQYPEYRFDLHKGYPTPIHFETLEKYGPCPIHRTTFAPVARLLAAPLVDENQMALSFDMTVQTIGEHGEAIACNYLAKRGMTILARRFRCAGGELDVVGEMNGNYHFIEVKTRLGGDETPAAAVDAKKRASMITAADAWVYQHGNSEQAGQYDIIEVIKSPDGRSNVRHIEAAFIGGE